MAGVLVITAELAGVFVEDSEDDRTFYGFSDGEISEQDYKSLNMEAEDEAHPSVSPKKQKASSKPAAAHPFRLRVALRSARSVQQSDDDDDVEEEEKRTEKRGVKRPRKTSPAKKKRHVKFEDEETAVHQPSPPEEQNSESEDVSESFLAKREQNIKANKAMLAQLMADLQKMPGGAGFLKKQAGKQPKERGSRPPRSGAAGAESRKNPDRASRRQTRSMGGVEHPSAQKEEELELSLEEELLEVRRAPRSRGNPRHNQSKPHIIRPVEDITEDEILLIADNMTEKVYDRVTSGFAKNPSHRQDVVQNTEEEVMSSGHGQGSTCHQCRQKTTDTKTCCRSEDCRGIQGQFCGPCLRNRYGEDVRKALLDPEWRCPPCRGICNCSFCRQREGRCPTGILFPLAQYHGFSDVHSYLSSLRNKLKSEDD